MKLKTLCLVILSLSSIPALCQEDYVVTLEGDTIVGKINFRRDDLFDIVSIKNESGKQELRAYQTRSAGTAKNQFFSIQYQNRSVFGQLISRDVLSRFYVMPDGSNQFRDEILVKRDQKAMSLTSIGLRKRLINFLSECSVLTKQLQQRELQASDIEQVISVYKEQCSNQSSLLEANKKIESELLEFATLLIQIQERFDSNEAIPQYMLDALKRTDLSQMQEQIEELVRKIEK